MFFVVFGFFCKVVEYVFVDLVDCLKIGDYGCGIGIIFCVVDKII